MSDRDAELQLAEDAEFDALLSAAFADHPFGDEAVERILAGIQQEERQQEERQGRAASAGAAPSWTPRWVQGAAAAAAILIGGLLLSHFSSQAPSPAPEQVASARQVVGTLGPGFMRLDDADHQAGLELREGSELALGERLVALGQPSELRLSDGTRVAVHADTELFLEREEDGGLSVRLSGAEGRVFCEVAKQRAPFRVRGQHVDVQVLGTRFVVDQGVRASRVTVVEGRVEVRTSVDALVIGAGDQAEAALATGGRLGQIRVTPRRAALWVPALRSEQEALDAAEVSRESNRPAPPPVPTSSRPANEAPVGSAGLDQPVLPPRKQPSPLGPPRED